MKILQKVTACILVLSIIFAFASCKKDESEYEKDNSTTSTTESTTEPHTDEEEGTTDEASSEEESSTEKEEDKSSTTTTTTTTKPSSTKKPTTTESTGLYIPMAYLEGTWVAKETLSAKELYAPEFYDPAITKTGLVINSYYKFDIFGKFSCYGSLANESAFRAEFKAAAIAYYEKLVGEDQTLSQEILDEIDMLIDEEMEYLRSFANEGISGTYTATKTTINYTAGGISFSETYQVNGNKLTFTGSSIPESAGSYPITYTKVS